jgi:ribose/xylose/arabinose/galactoside ABC-type transport system permease subunit
MLAMFVLLMRVVDIFWWVGPTSMDIKGIQENVNGLLVRIVTWQDIVLTLGIFGIWLSYMLFLLKRRPMLARMEHGPELEEGGAHAHAAA